MRPIAEQNPTGKEPAEKPICPEKGIQDVAAVVAYICDAGVREVAVPLVLDAGDFAALVEDVDFAGDGCLFADALDLVHGGHV